MKSISILLLKESQKILQVNLGLKLDEKPKPKPNQKKNKPLTL